MDDNPDLSIIIPVHNELENLPVLHKVLKSNLSLLSSSYEIVFVDDGSTDGSTALLKEIHDRDETVNVIQLRKRFGKASALQSGFDNSQGKIIVTMDGDLQDRPEDIKPFLEKINQGCDLVIGRRRGVPLARSFFSHIFNRAVSLFTPLKIQDINCGLKAFKRPVIKNIRLYGEFHRFLPVFIARKGYHVEEVDVKHQERLHGKSKYGLSRVPKAFLSLFAVILLAGYTRRPLHLFGSVGIIIGLAGFAINAYLTGLRLFTGSIGGHYTLLLVGVMLMILGLQWFSTGIISELINNYFEEESD